MRSWLIVVAALAATPAVAPSLALAEDNQAGTPLALAEAAGAWTVQTEGRDVCVLTLKADRAGAGYAVNPPATCDETLPGKPVAWQPTPDGMRLLAADGRPLIAFNRWSNSLFVAHRSSGFDVQLRRGGVGG
jgi:hypothetical protein